MQWYLRSCPVCTGDLHDDPDDAGSLTCFMCARSFRAGEAPNLDRRTEAELAAAWLPGGLAARPIRETEEERAA